MSTQNHQHHTGPSAQVLTGTKNPTSLAVYPHQYSMLEKKDRIVDGKYRGVPVRILNPRGKSK